MQSPTTLSNGVTIENFAEHIRKVEQYLAYQDPETVLLEKVQKQISEQGCSSIPEPQLYYYALSLFLDCVFSGALETLFKAATPEVCSAMNRALALLQPELLSVFLNWRQQFENGEAYVDDEISDQIDSIHDALMDLDAGLSAYAEEHKLFAAC